MSQYLMSFKHKYQYLYFVNKELPLKCGWKLIFWLYCIKTFSGKVKSIGSWGWKPWTAPRFNHDDIMYTWLLRTFLTKCIKPISYTKYASVWSCKRCLSMFLPEIYHQWEIQCKININIVHICPNPLIPWLMAL